MDADVLAACESLLDRLQWVGVAMIEGKRDERTGKWYVMEINGRFWGSLQLAIDSGVDFPAILLRAALGGAHVPPTSWRTGLRLQCEWGEVDHLLLRMIRSRTRLSRSEDALGGLAALAGFLDFRLSRDRLEVFRLSDPLPFINETLVRMSPIRYARADGSRRREKGRWVGRVRSPFLNLEMPSPIPWRCGLSHIVTRWAPRSSFNRLDSAGDATHHTIRVRPPAACLHAPPHSARSGSSFTGTGTGGVHLDGASL